MATAGPKGPAYLAYTGWAWTLKTRLYALHGRRRGVGMGVSVGAVVRASEASEIVTDSRHRF